MRINNFLALAFFFLLALSCSTIKKTEYNSFEKVFDEKSDSVSFKIERKTTHLFQRKIKINKLFRDTLGKYEIKEVFKYSIFNNSKNKYTKRTYMLNNNKKRLVYFRRDITIIHLQDKKSIEKKYNIDGYKKHYSKMKHTISGKIKIKECFVDSVGTKVKILKKLKAAAIF